MLSASLSLVLLLPPGVQALQSEAQALDRLRHPDGTVTGRAGITHVERRGHGPVPLLLIAGAPFGWHAWEGFMARNEERYTMIALTQAGYDGSPPPAMPAPEHADYSERAWTEAWMSDLVDLIGKEWPAGGKLGAPIVVGHHLMGDYYAVQLAARQPARVRAVVSVAGQGSVPIQGPPGAEARLAFVRDSRAPFFRTVSQGTWNANTFTAETLSSDPQRGRRLYEAEIAVPLATQIRYYLEYMTDELEPALALLTCPVLALQVRPRWGFENLSKDMQDQLVVKFGSLEAAKQQVHFGGAWDGLAQRAQAGLVRVEQIEGAGVFMMDDAPEAFDRALAEFVAGLPTAAPTAVPAASGSGGE